MRRALLLLFGLFWIGCATADPALLAKLREGGYVLYLRHASTDFGQNDSNMTSYEDCTSQRNLTDKGREEARAIGAHVRRLGIPIGEVLASPYCRTMETARLAFGKARASNDVRGGPVEAGRYSALAGSPYLAEGEIAVVRPEGGMRFTVVARIPPADWPALRAAGDRAW